MDQMLREQVFNIVDSGDDGDTENDGPRQYQFEHQLLGCIQGWKSTDQTAGLVLSQQTALLKHQQSLQHRQTEHRVGNDGC